MPQVKNPVIQAIEMMIERQRESDRLLTALTVENSAMRDALKGVDSMLRWIFHRAGDDLFGSDLWTRRQLPSREEFSEKISLVSVALAYRNTKRATSADLLDRLRVVGNEIYRYAYCKDESTGERYPAWSEIAQAEGAIRRAIEELEKGAGAAEDELL